MIGICFLQKRGARKTFTKNNSPRSKKFGNNCTKSIKFETKKTYVKEGRVKKSL